MAAETHGGAAPDHWFEPLASHMGSAYLRYSFTKHTPAEVDFLLDVLDLAPGDRLLDVGCGPGRHVIELARRGIEAVGVDISQDFINLATAQAHEAGVAERTRFERLDARALASASNLTGPFDAVVAMCQGGFGLQAGPAAGPDPVNLLGDLSILRGMAQHLVPGGRLGVAAFSAYFQVQHLDSGTFDPLSGTHHEATEVRDPTGTAHPAELWTTCFTPRELWLLAESAGLAPVAVHGVSSVGEYRTQPPDLGEPEFFLVAQRPTP